jgi:ornithine cyclodeaminase/alanine dehydrogenase-like protein (mu-crystallin family)
MLILTAEDVRRALPMRDTIEAMKSAYASLSDGRAVVPLRTRLPIPPHEGLSLFMPAYVQTKTSEALAVKIVSLFPENPKRGLAYIQAAVLVLEADTGRALALMEGGSLTAIRTGAGSGAAIDVLARPDSRVLAVFGAGVQGRTQTDAACTVRAIETVWVFDANPEQSRKFAAEMSGRGPITREVHVAESAMQAVRNADIVCTATTSTSPVFADRDLKRGAHVSAVGSYTPEMQEVPAETIQRARVVVDSRSATLAETGDLIKPIQAGLITDAHIFAELGEIVLGRKTGRQSNEEITYFKSVGVAVQDAMAAQLALKNARIFGLGPEVSF